MQVAKRTEEQASLSSRVALKRGQEEPAIPLRARLWQHRWTYALIVPGIVYLIIFHYIPLWGNIIAFQDYSIYRGFAGSAWVGFQNFIDVFSNPNIGYVIWNTILLSLLQIIFAFPAAIILALMLNALISERFKRFMQSVLYLPHFLGWVILISIWQQFFGADGFINHILELIGLHPINFITNSDLFRPMLILQVMWKETGWGTVIFLAALSTIDINLYEAAVIDGAGGWKRLWHITLPGIRGIIIILLILRMGNILTTGFEQIVLQMQGVDIHVAQTIDIFNWIQGIQGGQWGITMALGLVKMVVGTCLILLTNTIVKKFGEEGLI